MKAKTWQETVMNQEELVKIYDSMPSDAKYGDVSQEIAKKQAKITGDIACKAGGQEEIREVMEWFEREIKYLLEHPQGVEYPNIKAEALQTTRNSLREYLAAGLPLIVTENGG